MTALDPAARPGPAEVAESLSSEVEPVPEVGGTTALQTAAIQSVSPTEALPTAGPAQAESGPPGPPDGLPVRGVRARSWLTDARHRPVVAAAGLAVVLFVILLSVFLSDRNDPPTTEPRSDPPGATIPEDVRDAITGLRESVEP